MLTQNIIIRDALEHEQDTIAEVMIESYSQYKDNLTPEQWNGYRNSIYASAFHGTPYARLVAEIDGQIVGSAQLFRSSIEAYGNPNFNVNLPFLRLIAVLPELRGKGIATMLIHEAGKRVLAIGEPTLYLHTSDMMESAIKLYERLGFERSYETDMINGDNIVVSYKLNLLDLDRLSASPQ